MNQRLSFAIEPANIALVTPPVAICKFSEPSASKPVPAKSDTSISNVIALFPSWLVVKLPPVFKPSPAVIVTVESLIPVNSDTCEDDDTIPEPLKSICPCDQCYICVTTFTKNC